LTGRLFASPHRMQFTPVPYRPPKFWLLQPAVVQPTAPQRWHR
jgi:hypothetical protein